MFALRNYTKIICAALCAFSCASGNFLTPEKAFSGVYAAFAKQDIALMRNILSIQSIAKIEAMRQSFAAMDVNQANEAAKLYGISGEEFKSISLEKFISVFLSSQKDVIFSGNFSLAEVRESGDSAVVLLRNGNELDFVKEGIYWKFDLTAL